MGPQLSTMPQLPTTLSTMPSTMLPLSTTSPTMVMSNPSITAQFKMLLRPLKFAPQLLRLSATPLSLPSRSLLTKSSATQSPVLSVPRVLRLPLRSNVTLRWLPSASQPQDTDTTATDTTTARRLPRRIAIMSLLSPLLSQLLRLPTLSQSRPVSTSQSLSQESAARTSQRRSASLSQRLRTPPLPPRSASPSLLLLPARMLSLLSPSRFARRSTMDMLRILMRLSQSPMLLPPLLMPLKMVIRPD